MDEYPCEKLNSKRAMTLKFTMKFIVNFENFLLKFSVNDVSVKIQRNKKERKSRKITYIIGINKWVKLKN